jgi:hypothetical protein
MGWQASTTSRQPYGGVNYVPQSGTMNSTTDVLGGSTTLRVNVKATDVFYSYPYTYYA